MMLMTVSSDVIPRIRSGQLVLELLSQRIRGDMSQYREVSDVTRQIVGNHEFWRIDIETAGESPVFTTILTAFFNDYFIQAQVTAPQLDDIVKLRKHLEETLQIFPSASHLEQVRVQNLMFHIMGIIALIAATVITIILFRKASTPADRWIVGGASLLLFGSTAVFFAYLTNYSDLHGDRAGAEELVYILVGVFTIIVAGAIQLLKKKPTG